MTRKYLTERRRRNAELARLDRENRCPVCFRAITRETGRVGWRGQSLCSPGCLDIAIERLAQQEPR